MRKHLTLISLLLAAILLLTGCKGGEELVPREPAPLDFSKGGMTITLTDAFTEKDYVSYTACYESRDIAVFVLKEEFSLFANTEYGPETTVEEYVDLVRRSNALGDNVLVTNAGNLCYLEYNKEANGKTLSYKVFGFKGADAFWLLQFAADAENYPNVVGQIDAYAQSFRIN